MLTGLNHLTLAVTDVGRSVGFYRDLLGFSLAAVWDGGAYLALGDLWLCVSLDPARAAAAPGVATPGVATPGVATPGVATPGADYTHYAFSIAQQDFAPFCARLRAAGAQEWRRNRSEGDSFYFLDPDGHQLEAHVGDLASRLAQCRAAPYAGMRFADGTGSPSS